MTYTEPPNIFEQILHRLWIFAVLNGHLTGEQHDKRISEAADDLEKHEAQAIEGVAEIAYKAGYEDGFKHKENNLTQGWKEAKQYLIKKFRGKVR